MGFGHTWVVDVESQQVQPDDMRRGHWQAGQWYPAESMLQSIPEHFHDEFQALLKMHCQGLAEGQAFSFEHPQIRSDTGQLLWVKVYGKLTTVGGRKQIHGQVIDRTNMTSRIKTPERTVRHCWTRSSQRFRCILKILKWTKTHDCWSGEPWR